MILAVFRDVFPFLAALYVLDGLAWVGALDLLFVRWIWGWSAVEGRGLRLAGILPLDLAFSASGPAAIRIGDEVLVPEATARGAGLYDPGRWTSVPYDSVSPEVKGKLVLSLDAGAARTRLEAFREETQLLRVLSWGLFVLTLLLLPAVLYLHPLPERLLGPLLLGILALYAGVVGAAAFVGSRLRKDGILLRAVPLSTLLLSPISAARAVPALGRNLFEGFDPLAVAAALLPRDRFLERARAELYGAAIAEGRGERDWQRHWRERKKALLRLLEREGIGEAEALAAPVRRDPEAQSWCPFCGTEYRAAKGFCEDCDLPLSRFS